MNAKPALVRPRFASDLDPQAALWIARLGASLTEVTHQLNESMSSDELRRLIGITPQEGKLSKNELRPLLKSRADELEQQLPRNKTVLTRNVDMLGKLLGLDKLQKEVLAFAALSEQHPLLSDVIENARIKSTDAITKILSIALSVSEAEINKAIRADGHLLITRIISIESSVHLGRGLRLELPPSLRDALFSAADSIQKLMSSFLENSPPPNLKADAFAHLNRETELLTAYLSKASSSRTRGINVLIYGPPGTGKTEYVRWLVAHQRKQLYQVRATDDQGGPIDGQDRIAFYQMSQAFLQKSDALMLFDEIEDVFPSGEGTFSMFSRSRKPVAGKMFINRLLENNPVPAIWISNEVSHIDKAYLRRFDFSFEMGIPPIAVRRGILHKYLREHRISKEAISTLSQHKQLTPAQIEKAAKVLKLSDEKSASREATLSLVIENSMALLEQDKIDPILTLAECGYQLDYLNPDCDLTQLVAQLKRAPDSVGALCFYGAPGTGKTALAHYLAREIQLPLLVRRASDILSPYVGETEHKIALMFKQAQKEGALLLLDEADSFLRDRKSANYSWEVTAVNEMLTQMERFDGLFICSTNLMQRLDTASLRRFALKIKFDYLKPEQRWRLFLDQAKKLPRSREAEYRAELKQLNNLTPGDFATVRRQAALLSVTLTAEELLNRLKQECKSKGGIKTQQIGFICNP
ncbi:MAG: ATP-binding protein [Pseudomonadota bacterium]